ncbi:2,3-dimethylmalate dehydratase small subunit [bioreactor metagenome]|uniref:2,3-dimethylmalate dehydratase small subunit n=2 Tax=root TaxID=1 RepID=A0A645G462_9ZZZZ
MPSNAKLLPFRSNIPYLSNYCFNTVDEEFPQRAIKNKGGFIVGGDNYGQGSSREHAALAPLYLGIKGVLVKSFARIHKANLINSGIIPMVFECDEDYEKISLEDKLEICDLYNGLIENRVKIINHSKNESFYAKVELSPKEVEVVKAGGKLNYTKNLLEKVTC